MVCRMRTMRGWPHCSSTASGSGAPRATATCAYATNFTSILRPCSRASPTEQRGEPTRQEYPMIELGNLQAELALNQAIDRQLDALVARANQTVLVLGAKPRGIKENQLRNVVNVAGSVDSIEALLNFI